MASILGSSVSTTYQIQKFFENNNIKEKNYLIDFYVKYGTVFNVQCDVALGMMLIYTDFLKIKTENNNLVGIGKQFCVNKLEEFPSEEECIIAQYELLRTGADPSYIAEYPHSFTYGNLLKNMSSEGEPSILVGNIQTIEDVYITWKLFDSNYSVQDFWIITRDIPIIRNDDPSYDNPREIYFFVRVAISSDFKSLLKNKSDIVKKGFKDVSIRVGNGFYQLEVGSLKNEKDATTVVQNLRMFGYGGIIQSRKVARK